MITVEIKRGPGESNSSLLRRFSRRVQGSGMIRKVKGLKARERAQSPFKVKKNALKRLARRATLEQLRKLGKISNAIHQPTRRP